MWKEISSSTLGPSYEKMSSEENLDKEKRHLRENNEQTISLHEDHH